MSRFDEIRASLPGVGFALYAMNPGEPVTLEVYTPDGEVFSFVGRNEDDVLNRAFPRPQAEVLPVKTPEVKTSIFD